MYYNEETIIYLDNEFVKAADSKMNLYSQSLHYGYSAFEGIRSYKTANGIKIFKQEEHFERLRKSCEAVGIPYPWTNEELINATYRLLEKNNLDNAYIRPLVFCPPNMSLQKATSSHILLAAWEWGPYLGNSLL